MDEEEDFSWANDLKPREKEEDEPEVCDMEEGCLTCGS